MAVALAAFSALALAGCGLPDPLEAIEPVHGCLGPFSLRGPGHLDGVAIQANEEIAKQIFVRAGVLRSSKRFCEAFGGIPIAVYPSERIDCSDGLRTCLGTYGGWGVELSRDAGALVHELLHAYETENFVWNTGDHPQWAEKGYVAMSDEYFSRAAPIVTP